MSFKNISTGVFIKSDFVSHILFLLDFYFKILIQLIIPIFKYVLAQIMVESFSLLYKKQQKVR